MWVAWQKETETRKESIDQKTSWTEALKAATFLLNTMSKNVLARIKHEECVYVYTLATLLYATVLFNIPEDRTRPVQNIKQSQPPEKRNDDKVHD